jgi:hypothetical protein
MNGEEPEQPTSPPSESTFRAFVSRIVRVSKEDVDRVEAQRVAAVKRRHTGPLHRG